MWTIFYFIWTSFTLTSFPHSLLFIATFKQNLLDDILLYSSNIYLKYISMLDSRSSEDWLILFKQCFLNFPENKTTLQGGVLVKIQISGSHHIKPLNQSLRERANNLYFLTSITSEPYKVNLGNAALQQHCPRLKSLLLKEGLLPMGLWTSEPFELFFGVKSVFFWTPLMKQVSLTIFLFISAL